MTLGGICSSEFLVVFGCRELDLRQSTDYNHPVLLLSFSLFLVVIEFGLF